MDETEKHSSLCCGCLSVDRRVKPLTEFVDLFANLLGKEQNYELKLTNTKLCWECLALLKRIYNFQKRIKDAHCMLSSLHLDDSLSIPSLSTLSTIKQDSYQAVVQYESGEMKTTRDICFGEVVVIKEEVDHDLQDYNDEHPTNMLEVQIESYKPIKNESEVEIKCDSNLDDKKGHVVKIDSKERRSVKKEMKPELLVNQIITCEDLKKMKMLNKKEIKRIKCNEHSLNDATIMKNGIDFNNVFKYFVKVKMNKNDIEESLEMKRNSADYNTMPYKCDLCVSGFMSSFYLKKHEKTYHTEGDVPFECTVCKRGFPTRHAVLSHTAVQHSTLRCRACDHLCWGRSMPVTHLKTHLFTYTCNFCSERFSSIGSFVAHRRKFHRQFICDHCGKQVSSKTHMKIHLRIHGNETFECGECGKTFPSRRTRLNHVAKYHTGAERTREASFCVECDKQFENTYKYKKHLRNSARHNSNNRAREKQPIPCAECGKIVTRKYMRNHIKLYHLKKNNHYCEICDKHFVTNSTLRNHHRFVHEKQEKPRNKECELCGRLFFTNRMLINHIRTHTGEKPHICKHCGASFAQNTAMKMHERRHKQC